MRSGSKNVAELLLLVGLASAGPLVASDSPVAAEAAPPAEAASGLPTGEEVLGRYIDVTGGREAYEKLRNRFATGTVEIAGQGISGPISLWQQNEPERLLLEINFAGLGRIESGSDGTVVWEKNPMTGPRVLAGPERSAFLRTSAMNADIDWKRFYDAAECTGTEMIDGRPSYRVALTPLEGPTVTSYYDVESGLLVRTDATIETQMGDVPSRTRVSEYREADGILVPHVTHTRILSMEQVISLSEVHHNVEMAADRFELPDEIVALVAKGLLVEAEEEEVVPETLTLDGED